jgi:ParB-like nuclease domain
MTAIEKTNSIQRKFLPMALLDKNENNPNVMTDEEFNLLADNVQQTGMTDPILVRPLPTGRYRIVGGHHRYDYALVEGFEEVPCTIITDPAFDDDMEAFQVIRMNVIHGRISPDKFMKMWEGMAPKYSVEVAQEMFGFASEEEFRALVKQVSQSVPKELKVAFDKGAKEVQTIKDLSKLLNGLFTQYGDTVPYGFMLLDYGGKDSVWLRLAPKGRKELLAVGQRCIAANRSVDSIIGGMIRLMAAGKLDAQILQLIAETPAVQIPAGVELPTEEQGAVAA